jgi:pyruvate-formate lyase-activating enzyme
MGTATPATIDMYDKSERVLSADNITITFHGHGGRFRINGHMSGTILHEMPGLDVSYTIVTNEKLVSTYMVRQIDDVQITSIDSCGNVTFVGGEPVMQFSTEAWCGPDGKRRNELSGNIPVAFW